MTQNTTIQATASTIPLTREQSAALAEITAKLRILAFTSPEAFAKLNTATDAALATIQANAESLPAGDKAACLSSSGRFGGASAVALRAAHEAKIKADRALIASIPREKIVLLHALHGSDESKIAVAWRNLQSVKGGR